ncbi:MAG: response regulator [Leptospiraceae bacterium]|nr:response regulator [Leptospiraceae bacterium]
MQIIRFIFSILSILLINCNYQSPVQVEKGFLDLHNDLIFSRGERIVTLSGEWEFYWKQFLDPVNFSEMETTKNPETNYMGIPFSWNGASINGETLGAEGYATYRMVVRLPPDSTNLALKVQDMRSSFRLYANKELVFSNGQVGTTRETTIPQFLPGIAFLPATTDTIVLTLHVANFHHRLGGAKFALELGEQRLIQSRRDYASYIEAFFIGCLFITGFYHLILFTIRKNCNPLFYFSCLCFLILMYCSGRGEQLLFQVFPDFNWELGQKIRFLSFYISIPLFAAFVQGLFPEEITKRIVNIIWSVCSIFIVIVLIFPTIIFSKTALTYEVISGLILSYLIFEIYLAAKNKNLGAKTLLIAISITLLFLLNDILYTNEVISTLDLAPFGLFFLILSMATILAKQYEESLKKEEILTGELQIRSEELEELNQRLLRSITEKEKKEQESVIMEKFLSLVAHDIRGPLSGISICSQLLIEDGYTFNEKELNNWHGKIQLTAKELLATIDKLLDMNRLKRGRIVVQASRINLKDLMCESIASLLLVAEKKKIQIENNIPEEMVVIGDSILLREVFHNLTVNAIKFSHEKGSVVITGMIDENKISVKDSGIGILPQFLPNLFKLDVKTSTKGTKGEKGSGLGLSFCKEIIDAHRGKIQVYSTIGIGTEFTIELPQSKKIIALCENRDIIRQDIADFLWNEGWHVLEFEDGRYALDSLKNLKPDIILTDFVMPEIDGLELTQQIKSVSEYRNIPIILFSSVFTDNPKKIRDMENIMKLADVDYFLPKPIDKTKLKQILEKY